METKSKMGLRCMPYAEEVRSELGDETLVCCDGAIWKEKFFEGKIRVGAIKE